MIKEAKSNLGHSTDARLTANATAMEWSCGRLLGALQKLGNRLVFEGETIESREHIEKRLVKMSMGNCYKKVERIKRAFKDGKEDLLSDDGPGILLCCAVVQYKATKKSGNFKKIDLLKNWIAKKSDIRYTNEEVEFDARGNVTLSKNNATIVTGEIKSSGKRSSEGAHQIIFRINLVVFFLDTVFQKRIKKIVRKGHLFLLEDDNDSQEVTINGTSIEKHIIYQ